LWLAEEKHRDASQRADEKADNDDCEDGRSFRNPAYESRFHLFPKPSQQAVDPHTLQDPTKGAIADREIDIIAAMREKEMM
jgi:hypothetical protein